MAITCDVCHEAAAELLLTTVEDGDVTGLCGRDMPAYLVAMVGTLAPEVLVDAARMLKDAETDEPTDEPDAVPDNPAEPPPTYVGGDPDNPTHPEQGDPIPEAPVSDPDGEGPGGFTQETIDRALSDA